MFTNILKYPACLLKYPDISCIFTDIQRYSKLYSVILRYPECLLRYPNPPHQVNLHFAVGSLLQVVAGQRSVPCDQLVAISDRFFMELVVCVRMVQFFSSLSPADATGTA